MPKVSRIIVRLWSGFLALVFLAVSILGIIAIVLVKSYPGIGAGLLVFGIVGLAISIAGLAGAGFEKSSAEESSSTIKAFLLIIFFAVMLILHVLFMIFGVALCAISSAVDMLTTMEPSAFEKLFHQLPDSFEGSVDIAIGKIKSFAIGLGVVIIVISVIIFITCVGAAFLMGKLLFTRFFMVSFSIVEIIIGLALAIFLLILNASHNNVYGDQIEKNKNVIIPVAVFGFILAVVGIIGFIAVVVGHKYKIISFIFNTGNIVVLVAFLVLFILACVFLGLITGLGNNLCPAEGTPAEGTPDDKCFLLVSNVRENNCVKEDNKTECVENQTNPYNDERLKSDVGKFMKGFAGILLFVCLYLVLFLSFVVVSTCINCFRKPEETDEEATRPLFNFY